MDAAEAMNRTRNTVKRTGIAFVVVWAVVLLDRHLDPGPSGGVGTYRLFSIFGIFALWVYGHWLAVSVPPRAEARQRPWGREVSLSWWRRLLLAAFPWPILALFITSKKPNTWAVVPFALCIMVVLWLLSGNRAWLTAEAIVWKRPFRSVRRILWSDVRSVRVILPRTAVYSTDGSMMGVNLLVEDGGAEFAAELLRHGCPVEGNRGSELEAVADVYLRSAAPASR